MFAFWVRMKRAKCASCLPKRSLTGCIIIAGKYLKGGKLPAGDRWPTLQSDAEASLAWGGSRGRAQRGAERLPHPDGGRLWRRGAPQEAGAAGGAWQRSDVGRQATVEGDREERGNRRRDTHSQSSLTPNSRPEDSLVSDGGLCPQKSPLRRHRRLSAPVRGQKRSCWFYFSRPDAEPNPDLE